MSHVRITTGSTGVRSWKYFAAILLWGVVLYGALSIANLETDWSGAICGPWGCTAPLEAIVACHLGWLVVLTPALYFAAGHTWLRRVAYVAILVVGVGGAAWLIVQEMQFIGWSLAEPYLVQRISLKLLNSTDLPVIPAMVLGLVVLTQFIWVHCRRTRKTDH